MALNLDQRQRAMLQEMGITVWLPDPAAATEQSAAASRTVAAQPAAAFAASTAPSSAPSRPTPARPAAAPLPQKATIPATVRPASNADGAAQSWRLHPAQPVYAPSVAAETMADGGWLILLEHPLTHGLPSQATAAPGLATTALEGDAARLLDNMLRALRLHQHPRVWSAALERDTAHNSAQKSASQPLAEGLAAMVQTLRPARILVLGLAAARAVLGRNDALGRLRAEPHLVAGLPTVITYDPNYLLRAPHAKPAAWADLCMAKNAPLSVLSPELVEGTKGRVP